MTWEMVPLAELGTWTGGGTPSKSRPDYWDGEIPWLSPKDMGSLVLADTQDHISTTAVAESSTKLVPAGAVAIVTRSGILEHTLPSTYVPFDVTLNQDMKALAPRAGVDPKWVLYGLRAFEREILTTCRKAGTTVASIEWKRLADFRLPLPSLDEQRRIMELVEEQLSHLDAADAALATSKERANKLWGVTASQLLSQADHSLTPLQELLREPMRNGRSDRASANGEGIRCLTLTAVTRREFSDRWTKIAATAERTAAGLWLEPGDIFVQRSNTPELVGTSALYEGERHWAIFPDLLIRVRPDEKRVDRHFLAAALRSEACHRQLRKSAKGLAGSMPKIDQSALGRLPIPVPAMEQQKAIASQLMELEIDVLRMAHAIEAQSARCAALRRAVLAAAFSGRLTGSSSDTEIIEATAAAFPSPAQETLL